MHMHAWQAEYSLHASPSFTLSMVLNLTIPLTHTHPPVLVCSCLFLWLLRVFGRRNVLTGSFVETSLLKLLASMVG